MDPDAEPQPQNLRELRILVLHNSDFDGESSRGLSEDAPFSDMRQVARADVAHAAQHVARALAARGHFALVQGIDRDEISDFVRRLRQDPPDLVYNLVESLAGEDRHQTVIPSLLELLEIPYTGSGPLCLGTCVNKHQTKQLLSAASVPTPRGTLLPAMPRPRAEDLTAIQSIGYPLFLKLALEDGSIGISNASIVQNDDEFLTQLEHLRSRYRQPILAEQFIDGRELYVALLGSTTPRILPLQEMDFSKLASDQPRIVSQDSKWNQQAKEYHAITSVAAAHMPASVRARIEEVAQRAFASLDVWDYGRCDIRLSKSGTPYVIDVNPNCDLSDGAGYSRAGALAGLSYDRLIEEIALSALQRSSFTKRSHASAFHGLPESAVELDGSDDDRAPSSLRP